jgi:predicted TIM-barrel fold metal-dependent hydrolase
LNGGNDQPLPRIMDELPDDMILFSSDFPHFEGFADPAAHYAETLMGVPQARKDRFFGGAAAEMFKRMGDPLL